MLFPMWRIGYQGFSLWIVWVIFLTFLFAKELAYKKDVYLLTNKRLIHLKHFYKTEYKLVGFIKLIDIDEVYKHKNNIVIISQNKKYYLSSIVLVDKLFDKLNSYIKH